MEPELHGGPRGGPALRFHRPDGRLLPERPPVPDLGQDPVRAVERAQRGLGIDEWTPTPRWDGARLDVDWALLTLRRPAEPDVSAETRAAGADLPQTGPDASHRVSAETPT